MEPPKCGCGWPSELRMVRKEGPNKGRQFYGCANWQADGCGFFKWAPPGTTAAPQGSQQQRSPGGAGGSQPSQQQQQQQWRSPQSQPSQQQAAWRSPQPSQQQRGGQGGSPSSHADLQRAWWDDAGGGSTYRPPSQPSPSQLQRQGQWQSPQPPQQQQQQMYGSPAASSQPRPSPASQQPRYGSPMSSQARASQQQQQHGSPAVPSIWGTPSQQAADGAPVRVNLQLIDGDTVGAQFKYNEPLKDWLKSLPAPCRGRWDPARKLWTFPLSCYDELVQQLRQAAPVPVTLSLIPQDALSRLEATQEASREGPHQLADSEVEERLLRLPPELWGRLYGFQREGVRRGVALGGRCLLADEMGLGKTVQALSIAACFGPEDWPLLIVCPATMKLVWADAVRHWLPPELTPAPNNLAVIKDGQGMGKLLERMNSSSRARVCIASYDMVKKLGEHGAQFRTVIADESHHLKSLTAQRTQAVSALVKAAARAILVTGTPALSRPVELYPQINMLRPGFLGSLMEFGMRYCDGKPAQYAQYGTTGGMDFRGSSNLQELHLLLEQHIMIRRLKKDVLDDLPDKIRKRVPVEVDPAHRRGLAQTVQDMKQVDVDEANGEISGEVAAQRRQLLMTEYYRRTGPAKVRDAKQHVASLIEAGEKVLVFCHHQSVLDELQAACTAAGVKHVRIDGQVANERRKAAVDRFQQDPSCRAALLSITAAGVGITLTEATVCVFVELFWNPGHLIQAEDRAHRLGQKKALEVHYLVAPGTADDSIWELCKRKLGVVGGAMGDADADEAFEAVGASSKYRTAGERLAQQAEQAQQAQRERQAHERRQRELEEGEEEEEEDDLVEQPQTQQQAQQEPGVRQQLLERQRQLQRQWQEGAAGPSRQRGGSTAEQSAPPGQVEVIEISDSEGEGQDPQRQQGAHAAPASRQQSAATEPLSSGGEEEGKEVAGQQVVSQERRPMRRPTRGAARAKRKAAVLESAEEEQEEGEKGSQRRRLEPAGPD